MDVHSFSDLDAAKAQLCLHQLLFAAQWNSSWNPAAEVAGDLLVGQGLSAAPNAPLKKGENIFWNMMEHDDEPYMIPMRYNVLHVIPLLSHNGIIYEP